MILIPQYRGYSCGGLHEMSAIVKTEQAWKHEQNNWQLERAIKISADTPATNKTCDSEKWQFSITRILVVYNDSPNT